MALHDRYDLGEELGSGSFGRVHRGIDRQCGAEVAIKILHRVTDDGQKRLRTEAWVLYEQMSNEHVVRLYDHSLDGDELYIVEEFCDLGNLRRWVGARRPWEEVATALLHAVTGLMGVHNAGGHHRDLKPENLLLKRAQNRFGWILKLGDFGLAGLPHPATGRMTRTPWGTEGYVAPELSPGAEFSQAADIFALGVVGVELCLGVNAPSLLGRMRVQPDLAALLHRMTNANPTGRPSAADVAAALVRLLEAAETAREQAALAQQTIAAAQPEPSFFAELLRAAAPVALAVLGVGTIAVAANQSTKEWDGRVGRHRDTRNGKFRGGGWLD